MTFGAEYGGERVRSRRETWMRSLAGMSWCVAVLAAGAVFFESGDALAGQAPSWRAVVAAAEPSGEKESTITPQDAGAIKILNEAKPSSAHGPAAAAAAPPAGSVEDTSPRTGTPAEAAVSTPAAAKPASGPAARTPPPEDAGSGLLARDYCKVVLDQAAAAKIAQEKGEVKTMQAEIGKRLEDLEKAISVHKDWLRQRQEFLDKAQEVVVKLYSGMPAESAAQRLSVVTEEMAAAILMKLNAKAGSSILAEIEPQRAARITAQMAGAAEIATAAHTTEAALP